MRRFFAQLHIGSSGGIFSQSANWEIGKDLFSICILGNREGSFLNLHIGKSGRIFSQSANWEIEPPDVSNGTSGNWDSQFAGKSLVFEPGISANHKIALVLRPGRGNGALR